MKIGCVLMAAGLATRFGENKLLYPLEGRTLIERALQATPATLFTKAVSVTSDPQVAAIARAVGYEAVSNPDPSRGQGSSIVLGMQSMRDMDAVMFCVADQPYLSEATVLRMLRVYQRETICALSFQGKRGNPVLFPASCFAELAALKPSETGRVVIAKHPDRLVLVEATNARELHDIDTKDDLTE